LINGLFSLVDYAIYEHSSLGYDKI